MDFETRNTHSIAKKDADLEKPSVSKDTVPNAAEKYRVGDAKPPEPATAEKEHLEVSEQFHGLSFESLRGHVALPEDAHLAQFNNEPLELGHRVNGKIYEYNINQDALKGVLLEVDGGQLFRGDDLDRFFVVCKVQNIHVPFYVSSDGTGGKRQDEWYPFFGTGGSGWLIKGAIDEKTGDMFYHKEISRVQDVLNNNLKFPAQFFDTKGTVRSAIDGRVLVDLKKYLKYRQVEDSEKITGYHPDAQKIFDNKSPEGQAWIGEIVAQIKTDDAEHQSVEATSTEKGIEQESEKNHAIESNTSPNEQMDSRAEAGEFAEKLYSWTEEIMETWNQFGFDSVPFEETMLSKFYSNSKQLGNRIAMEVGLKDMADSLKEASNYFIRSAQRFGGHNTDVELNIVRTMQDAIKSRPQRNEVRSVFAKRYLAGTFNNADNLEHANSQLLAQVEASYLSKQEVERTAPNEEENPVDKVSPTAGANDAETEQESSEEEKIREGMLRHGSREAAEALYSFVSTNIFRDNENLVELWDAYATHNIKSGISVLENIGTSVEHIDFSTFTEALIKIAGGLKEANPQSGVGHLENSDRLRQLAVSLQELSKYLQEISQNVPEEEQGASAAIRELLASVDDVERFLSRRAQLVEDM